MADARRHHDVQVEVCGVWLNASPGLPGAPIDLLSEDERLRARRFRLPHLADSFVQTHVALRILAGRRLQVEPHSLVFSAGAFGKPQLEDAPAFGFNLSHSGGLAVFAFAGGCEVGVDVEQVHGVSDRDTIVEKYFSPAEQEEFQQVEANEREQAFFNAWTRKEAYVKARGKGLSIPLNSFSVSLRPGAAPVLDVPGRSSEVQWQLEVLQPAPGYAGALVYSGIRRRVTVLETVDFDLLWKSESCAPI